MTTSNPKISVLIPCYNYASYVATAIESALAQDYANKEILVIDDGSTDDSMAVIARYADRVTILKQKNAGMVAALTRAFPASSGEIVIFLDADDHLEPGALSAVARAWTPACSKVQWDLRIIDGEGRDLGRKFCHFTEDYDAERVRDAFRRTGTYRWPVTTGNAYSRAFVRLLFPLTVDHAPEGVWNTIAPLYGEVVTLPRALAAYRIHGRNFWSSKVADDRKLPERILHRRREIALLRYHADRRGVELPAGDLLDHEIAFINYRLMALQLGLDYSGKARDTPFRLWRTALRVLHDERFPVRQTLAHFAWFSALALAPSGLAQKLVELRYRRAALQVEAQRRVTVALERFKKAA